MSKTAGSRLKALTLLQVVNCFVVVLHASFLIFCHKLLPVDKIDFS